MAIGPSKDGKWVFNKACTTPWCHVVLHFEVKMSRFPAAFHDHRTKHQQALKTSLRPHRGSKPASK